MNIITKIKSIFKKEEPKHVRDFITQYSTGNNNSKWIAGDKVGYGCSYVKKCECGQWAVKHSGLDELVMLDKN